MRVIDSAYTMHKAKWWESTGNDKLLCTLCPRYCTIGDGQHGFCYIRKNVGGSLYSIGYGRPTGFAIDPIEKKPLNHFYPGSDILSFGTAGCNLGCKFCQNWSISKAKMDDVSALTVPPEGVIQLAMRHNTPSIAYTYNDPVIFGEYVIDVSRLAREQGIKNVLVTAGYIDKRARGEVFQYADAANVDLKAFTETFYHNLTFSHLNDILETLYWIKHETDIWLEITTLLIPGENDSTDEIKRLTDWIVTNLGESVPLHFSAFHPDFKMTDRHATPPSTLKIAREIGIAAGIKYCYTGNIHDMVGHTTFCPRCRNELIKRDWHTVISNHIVKGECEFCGEIIAGHFNH